jgi:hypothetical protein
MPVLSQKVVGMNSGCAILSTHPTFNIKEQTNHQDACVKMPEMDKNNSMTILEKHAKGRKPDIRGIP